MKDWLANQSKKLWVALASAVVLILKDSFGLSEETATQLMTIAGAYLVGQGVADFGKGKALVEGNGKPPAA